LIFAALAAPEAGALEISGQLRVMNGPARIERSVFVVRDASARVVFSDPHAFHLTNGSPVGLGMSSTAGPVLPATLGVGRYTAVWTVDGVASNTVRFEVGVTAPALELERAGTLLIAHLRNPGPRDLDLLDALETSTLVVDGVTHKRQGVDWDGPTGLPPSRAWAFVVDPPGYGVTPGAGRHHLMLQIADHRAQVVVDGR
jgi:hypothetical protein